MIRGFLGLGKGREAGEFLTEFTEFFWEVSHRGTETQRGGRRTRNFLDGINGISPD